jgi:hypothetical protein
MDINSWFVHVETNKKRRNYTHRLLHEDAIRHFRKLAGISLDPFDSSDNELQNQQSRLPRRDPIAGYPEKLNIITLQGYFGEIFAGIIAESYPHFGIHGWKVPAYPFRLHRSAYYVLEKWRHTGTEPGIIPGREGDDMVAFYKDDTGAVIHALVCEAKCSTDHDSTLIAKAHTQASHSMPRPVDILYLIEILQDSTDPESKNWANDLQVFYHREIQSSDERLDLVSYICGRSPVRSQTWVSSDEPHPNYTAGRKLEAVEIHLQNVEKLIKDVYGVCREE